MDIEKIALLLKYCVHSIFIQYFGDINDIFVPCDNEPQDETPRSYFMRVKKKRDDFTRKHNDMLDSIYDVIHWNYNFELDMKIAKEIVNQTATFNINGNLTTMPIIHMIRNMFIINSGLRYETADGMKDYIENNLVDYDENAATLFLVEIMCCDNDSISFQTKVDEEDIQSTISRCLDEPVVQPVVQPLAILGGVSRQIFDLPNKSRFVYALPYKQLNSNDIPY